MMNTSYPTSLIWAGTLIIAGSIILPFIFVLFLSKLDSFYS